MHQTNNGITASRKELMMICPDAAEEIDFSLTPPRFKPLSLVTYHDSDLAHDRETRRSTGGIVGIVDKTKIIHKIKRHTIM